MVTEFVEKYAFTSRPVIIRGGVDHWRVKERVLSNHRNVLDGTGGTLWRCLLQMVGNPAIVITTLVLTWLQPFSDQKTKTKTP